MSRRRISISIIQIIIAGVLIALLFTWKIKPSQLLDDLAGFNWFYVAPLLLLMLLLSGLSTYKWRMLLGARGFKEKFSRLFSLCFIGYFFNMFAPSTLGGDIVRGYLYGKDISDNVESYASVFMQRFTGVAALILISLVAFISRFDIVMREPAIAWSILLVYAGFAALVTVIFSAGARNLARRILARGVRDGIASRLDRFHDAIYYFRNKKKVILQSLAISLLFHMLTSVNVLVAARSIGAHVALLDLMLIVPIILIVSMIPITIGTWGVWEWAFSIFFSTIIVNGARIGTATAVVLRAKNISAALLGGLLFLLWRRRNPAEADTSNK